MATFVDTSAIYPLIVADDPDHAAVRAALEALRTDDEHLVTHSYVLSEAIALLQRRVGLAAVQRLAEVVPLLSIRWIDRDLHDRAFHALLASDRRSVSFVDEVSFLVMREAGAARALSLDRDFAVEGFEVIPG